MNIFSRLFGKKVKTENPLNGFNLLENSNPEIPQDPIPPEELFIDDIAPDPKEAEVMIGRNRMNEFLNIDYYKMGTKDGFEFHSVEMLEVAKQKIQAEFRLVIDRSIQDKIQQRLELKNFLANIGYLAESTRVGIENTLEEVDAAVHLLSEQKPLSVENEGWVMNGIHEYHKGFLQGLNDYVQGENLINSIKYL